MQFKLEEEFHAMSNEPLTFQGTLTPTAMQSQSVRMVAVGISDDAILVLRSDDTLWMMKRGTREWEWIPTPPENEAAASP